MRLALVTLAAALLLSGCSGGGQDEGADVSSLFGAGRATPSPEPTEEPTSLPTEEPTAEPAAEPTEEPTRLPTQPPSANARIGTTYALDNGLSLTVGRAEAFVPSDTAAGGEGATTFLRYTVTVTNGTSANYNTSGVLVQASSGGLEADQVFDTAKELDGAPDKVLPPGGKVAYDVGFGVEDSADVVLEFVAGPDYEEAVFAS